jgi:tetratricopeptide (TPR) repeat protein
VPTGPAVPDTVSADQLDPQVRAELRTLPGDLADAVARRLVAAELAEDPEQAYQFTLAARRLAARVGVVREACGIAAYRAGRWADALAELRTARRLTGRAGYLPLMADCERALGRPDRALAIINDPGVGGLDREVQIELRIVESGIRRDEGRFAAAAVALQVPELTDGRLRPWSARLFYAYADALLDAGRAEEARDWFGRAAAADVDGETDAVERFEDLDTVVLQDLAATTDDDTGPAAATHEREEAGPAAEDAGPGGEDGPAREDGPVTEVGLVGEDGPATEVGPLGEDGPATEDGPVAGHTGPAEEAG